MCDSFWFFGDGVCCVVVVGFLECICVGNGCIEDFFRGLGYNWFLDWEGFLLWFWYERIVYWERFEEN